MDYQINFEDEKQKIIGEITIRELSDFTSSTILNDYEYEELKMCNPDARLDHSPKTSILELTNDEKESLKISEFFYLISKHYFQLFTNGVIGPSDSKYTKWGISETNFGILALKSIGKSLKFSPYVKKYHEFENEILKNI